MKDIFPKIFEGFWRVGGEGAFLEYEVHDSPLESQYKCIL